MLAQKILDAYYPIKASKGTEYASIIVDNETYDRMTFIGVDGNEIEFWDAVGKVYKFNVFLSKIELKA